MLITAEDMELQNDVLVEILARLQVKSLIRFTCVCKYWLSLIRSPEFATKHYATRLDHLSQNHDEYDSLLATFNPACSISILSYESLALVTAFKFRPVDSYQPHFGVAHRDIISNCFIHGPCNGLFLIHIIKGSNRRVLLLWNPATREVFQLPDPNDIQCCNVGFGFDNVANDYKVVYFDCANMKSSVVELYSLAANTWKHVDAGLYFELGGKQVVSHISSSSNGRKHHWILMDSLGYEICYSLVSFDMVDEVFVQTPLPDESFTRRGICDGFLYKGSNYMYPTLYTLNMVVEQGIQKMHIWVLNRYGPDGFWNKQQCIDLSPELNWNPRVLWKNNAVVFIRNSVSSYNLLNGEMKSLRIPGDGSIISYTESLVSIAKFVRQQHPEVPRDHHEEADEDRQVEGENSNKGMQEISEEEEDDDDDGSSSIDSAFLLPQVKSFMATDLYYDLDYEKDLELYPLRKSEWERLAKLPYCLREVNKPMVSNPCTF